MLLPAILHGEKFRRRWNEASAAAFTRADLLAMIGLLALLVLMFRPAFASTRGNARTFVCLNNMRQLVLAWRAYAEDNLDRLPPNLSGSTSGSWVGGWEDWTVNNHVSPTRNVRINSKCRLRLQPG
jgi:hypothetical protein